jgi:hypothetical protein
MSVGQSNFFIRRKGLRGRCSRVRRPGGANRPAAHRRAQCDTGCLAVSAPRVLMTCRSAERDCDLLSATSQQFASRRHTPHSGQVGCYRSSVTDTAGPSGAIVAVTASGVTGTTCCCGAGGSRWRMRASLLAECRWQESRNGGFAKASGRTWRRKRHMNSAGDSVMSATLASCR